MRVNDVISKVKIKLKQFDYQKSSNYYTDEEILAFINDAQNDIIINHYAIEGYETFEIAPNVKELQLPDYIGRINKVIDNKQNVYNFYIPKEFYSSVVDPFAYALLNDLLMFKSAPSTFGADSINIYFKFKKAKLKANLIDQDLVIPSYYDKAIEYYTLSQLLTGDNSVFYLNMYKSELNEKAGVFYTRTEVPKPKGDW